MKCSICGKELDIEKLTISRYGDRYLCVNCRKGSVLGLQRRINMKIEIYGSKECVVCQRIKNKLEERGVDFEYITRENDEERLLKIARKYSLRKLPIIMIDGSVVSRLKFEDMMRKNQV